MPIGELIDWPDEPETQQDIEREKAWELAKHSGRHIGDKMPDGTTYAGLSPNTGRSMYTTLADAPLTMTFNEALENAAKLNVHGHNDWRVPTKAELNLLFNNRAAIGGFNLTGSHPAGWYYSASGFPSWPAWAQRFSDGAQTECGDYGKTIPLSLRYVR